MENEYEARVILRDGMHFEGVTQQGEMFVMHMDSDEEFGGMGKGSRPLDLMLVGLGGCMGMDVISILRKKQQKVDGLDIQLHSERAKEYPKVFTRIYARFIVTGQHLSPLAVTRSIELSMTKYCPAAAMLQQAGVPIETTFEIVESPAA
jgi:putative redox protein